jgi:hypothetical protein
MSRPVRKQQRPPTPVFQEGKIGFKEAAEYAFAVVIDNVEGSCHYHLQVLRVLEQLILAERRKIAKFLAETDARKVPARPRRTKVFVRPFEGVKPWP